ncbi:MAG TPA: translation elongation factor Ts [Candidatus Paceibacterota bacterium]
MPNISSDQIKELRERTNLSIMQCKKALEESDGDMEKALKHLATQGASIAEKKSTRELKAGVISSYVHSTKTVGAMLELNCETDFVAKNEEFVTLGYEIAMHVAAMKPADVAELLIQPFIKDPSKTIGDMVTEAVQKFGENTAIRRFTVFSVKE